LSPQFPTIVLRAQSDEKLARLVASGNERAFEAIVDRYRQPLLRYATRMIGDSRADDVVQAAFVSAWTKLAEGEDVRELKAWLYRIVHNGALNAMKRASSRDLPLLADNPMSTGDDSQSEVEQREAVREMLGEIAALPEQQRRAFLAVAVDGRRHRDVGLELGVSEGAVRMLIHRARSSVRAAAAAFSPGPLIAWFKGLGGGAAAGGSSAAAAGSAGAGVLTASAVKIGVVVATSAVVATAGPPAVKEIQSQVGVAPKHAVVAPKVAAVAKPAAPAKAHVGDTHADRPGAAPIAAPPASEPAAPAPSAPAPASEPAPAAAPAPAVAEQNDAVAIPESSQPKFVTPAVDDDDWILVEEDPPDYAAGERDVPVDGLPDNSGVDVNLPDPPDEAAIPDTPEPAAEAPAAEAPATPAPAPAETPAPDPAPSGNAPNTTTP
jgi:RNA polymerase sigma factor (sigma-70 family)